MAGRRERVTQVNGSANTRRRCFRQEERGNASAHGFAGGDDVRWMKLRVVFEELEGGLPGPDQLFLRVRRSPALLRVKIGQAEMPGATRPSLKWTRAVVHVVRCRGDDDGSARRPRRPAAPPAWLLSPEDTMVTLMDFMRKPPPVSGE
jgi:hypothetical protein